ncbi:MAG: c-type cytochrome [Candidatus Nitrohelix vancouverensis]|uniref:C-type cytochrome n=1 Tax=Candidatus Nitrohelix vancouverensis TaxID=2705534 RepID=A0A7T0C2W9_9BACT|nr:MAG: c-type cytochrome [Candidatus Nitrohelix vancouverensis]
MSQLLDVVKAKIFLALAMGMVLALPQSLFAEDLSKAKKIVEEQCSACHKFSGEHESKFNLKAPDLMWGGVKYQHAWLVRWLEGKEPLLYPNAYRWDQSNVATKHPKLSSADAESVARYMEANLKDDRVKENAIDLSKFTEREMEFGAELYKSFSCLGCHQIKEDGKNIGGPISVDLFDAGNRYDVDWLYRFALNPQDFTPHSGEYLADATMLGVRYIVGYLMTLGVADYKYHEPWTSEFFKNAKAERGATIYKNYCAQCHGFTGKADGPGALGLDPKPAVHAELPLSDYPDDYLYNLIFYGGKSVGKSSMMPDWGMTLPPQDIADVIAYIKSTFKGQ